MKYKVICGICGHAVGDLYGQSFKIKTLSLDEYKEKMKRILACWLLISTALSMFAQRVQVEALNADSWIEQLNTFPSSALTVSVAVDSKENIYVGANKTIYKSNDFGNSWQTIKSISPNYDFWRMYATANDYIISFLPNTFIYSTDYGQTWTNSTGITIESDAPPWNIAENSQGVLYSNNYDISTGQVRNDYVWRSLDNGETWSIWYNVTASGYGTHVHWVAVAPNDYVFVTTGDATVGSAKDDSIHRWNTTTWQIVMAGNQTRLSGEKQVAIWFDDNNAYFGADTCAFGWYMPITGTWSQAKKYMLASQIYGSYSHNEIFDAVTIGDIQIVSSNEGQILASWDGLHWVQIFQSGTTRIELSNRKQFPIYAVGYQQTGSQIWRINRITREDLVQLFYSTYRTHRGVYQNQANYVLEQRIFNGTNYLDLTNVALNNVQATIKGLSHYNKLSNPSFETGNTTGWTVVLRGGTVAVTTEDKYDGTYSAKVTKKTTDTGGTDLRQQWIVKEGDIVVVRWVAKSNATIEATSSASTSPMSLVLRNITATITRKTVYYGSTTSWTEYEYAFGFNSKTSWTFEVEFWFGKQDLITYFDATLTIVPEVDFQNPQTAVTQEFLVYHPKSLTTSFFSEIKNTTNPSLIIAGQTVFHSGELTNGTESSETSLTGILTGELQVMANIQGSGQAILKINATRVLYEDSIILQGRTSEVYYGRYYGTFSPTTTTTDLIAVTNLASRITSLSYSSNKLILIITSPSGTTSRTQVWCGILGSPQQVKGATSWTYNSATKIATISIKHPSSQQVQVIWTYSSAIPGDVDGDGDVDYDDFIVLAGACGSSVGQPAYRPEADFEGDGDVDYDDFLILAENYGKTAA